ncbi:MAG: type IV conjugative transfer system protein TraL [Robiginitomaculum sp.]|nr:MAG: type IV conjugative transfer system protein TraL [Robiginitomaculum sp.]
MARLYSNLDNMMRIVYFTLDEVMAFATPLVLTSFIGGAKEVLMFGIPSSIICFYILIKLKKDGGLFNLQRFLLWHITGGVQGIKHSPLSSVRVMTG